MKKILLLIFAVALSMGVYAQKTITVKGNVKFTQPDLTISILEGSGRNKVLVAETKLNSDNTFSMEFKVERPGAYTLDCGKVQNVQFWAEDEDIEVDFRGIDTAKIKIKNPPYVYIKGGRNNELMNHYNYDVFRAYQNMIAIAKSTSAAKLEEIPTSELNKALYGMNNTDRTERTNQLVRAYGDCNSVLHVLPSISDKELIATTVKGLEARNPNYGPLVKYKKESAEKELMKGNVEMGKVAPDFTYLTPDGKKLSPKDFKGKFLVIDFWASWCGPCRAEIPNMLRIYADYKDKGVEFLSVSIDAKDADWKKAIDEEKMPWPQILADNAGKELMKQYQFGGIPYIILLDKEGRIIAKGLRGEKMRQTIEEAVTGKLKAEPKKTMMMGTTKK